MKNVGPSMLSCLDFWAIFGTVFTQDKKVWWNWPKNKRVEHSGLFILLIPYIDDWCDYNSFTLSHPKKKKKTPYSSCFSGNWAIVFFFLDTILSKTPYSTYTLCPIFLSTLYGIGSMKLTFWYLLVTSIIFSVSSFYQKNEKEKKKQIAHLILIENVIKCIYLLVCFLPKN